MGICPENKEFLDNITLISDTLNSINIPFQGFVWKLSADPLKPYLVAEIRDSDTRSVEFAAISLETGAILSRIKDDSRESWWTGLLHAWNGKFFTHGYRDPKFPGQKGVACYDSATGALLWINDDLSFYGISTKGIILAGPGESEPNYFLADVENGTLLKKINFEEVIALRKEAELEEGQLHLLRYPEGSTHFSTVSAFIKERTNHSPVAAVEYAERPNCFIISYYKGNESHLSNYILLAAVNGELLFHDRTGSELSGTGFDNFLVIKDRLIYIKDKKEVVFLSLS